MKLVNQYPKQKKIKNNHLSRQERIVGIAEDISNLAKKRLIMPITTTYITKFFGDDKEYKQSYQKQLRKLVTKEIKKLGEVALIQTVLISQKTKKNGVEKQIPQGWFYCAVERGLVMDWFLLSENFLLHRNIEFDTIITLFRNSFLTFFDDGQMTDIKSTHRFMKFFNARIEKVKKFVAKLREQKPTKEQEMLKKQLLEKHNLELSLDEQLESASHNPNVDNYDKNVKHSNHPKTGGVDKNTSESLYPLDTSKDSHFSKIKKDISNKKNNEKDKRIAKLLNKTRFELLKTENNKRANRALSKFYLEKEIQETEKVKTVVLTKEGKTIDRWYTRPYTGHDLNTSDSYKRYLFKRLSFLIKHHKDLFFEFLQRIGISGLYRYKKMECFTKKQWYRLIMKGYSKLLYGLAA